MDSFVKSLLEMDARWPDLAGQRTDAPTDLESVAAFETLLDGNQLERASVDQLIALVGPVVFSSCYLLRKCMPPGLRLFRARITPDRPESASDVSYPPPSTVTNLGRFNRVGESRFYASLARPAAALEVRPRQGDWIALSVWEVTSSIWLDWFGYSGEVLTKMDSGHHLIRN